MRKYQNHCEQWMNYYYLIWNVINTEIWHDKTVTEYRIVTSYDWW